MRHFTRISVAKSGYHASRLIDHDGQFVVSYDAYINKLIAKNYSQNTITRYGYVVASFLDYLTEVGVLGKPATRVQILHAVDHYVPILLGADLGKLNTFFGDASELQWELIADRLQIQPVSRKSLSNILAAINKFLKLSNELHEDAIEKFGLAEVPMSTCATRQVLFPLAMRKMSVGEQKALMQNSTLANVMRLKPGGIKRPKPGLSVKFKSVQEDRDDGALDFPMLLLKPLFQRATSRRNLAYWLLLAGTGLRSHEAEQLRLPDIDFDSRLVFVNDPHNYRYASQLEDRYKLRFKGRTVSQVYFMQPFRDLFFEALEEYWKFEYDPRASHDFIFQDIRRGQNGRPFFGVSDHAKVKAFNEACDAIGVSRLPSGRRYGRHSLRHFYGVFTLNYLPLPDGYGLQLHEVQRLMGHQHVKSTQ